MACSNRSLVAVVVVNYGSHELLRKNIVPLSRHSPEIAVVIVDNYTNQAERAAVGQLSAAMGWTLKAPQNNLGFGAGMNLGVAAAIEAGSRYFLLLNPDACIDENSLEILLDAVITEPMAMVAPRILRPDGTIWFDGSDLYLDSGETRSSRKGLQYPGRRRPWLTGACLVVSKELWVLTGGFDESYFLYWEDVDLSFRVVANGGRIDVLREATAVHDEGGTHLLRAKESRAKSPLYYYYNIRNRLLFASLNLSADDVRRWKRSSLKAAYNIVLRGGRRQFLAPISGAQALGAAIRGTWDGLRVIRVQPFVRDGSPHS